MVPGSAVTAEDSDPLKVVPVGQAAHVLQIWMAQPFVGFHSGNISSRLIHVKYIGQNRLRRRTFCHQ